MAQKQKHIPDMKMRGQLLKPYYHAFGRFIKIYATLEHYLFVALVYYAKTSRRMGKAIFPNITVENALGAIERIAAATNVDASIKKDLKFLFAQVRVLNSARNKLLHFGWEWIGDEELYVTDSGKAVSKDKIVTFNISEKILGDMTLDCVSIISQLGARHLGKPPIKKLLNVDQIVKSKWRYAPSRPKRIVKRARQFE